MEMTSRHDLLTPEELYFKAAFAEGPPGSRFLTANELDKLAIYRGAGWALPRIRALDATLADRIVTAIGPL